MLLGRKKLYRFSWSTIGKNLKKCYEKVCLLWSFPKARLKHWCWHLKYIIKECNPSCTRWFWNICPFLVVGNILFFIFTAYIPIIYMIDSYIYMLTFIEWSRMYLLNICSRSRATQDFFFFYKWIYCGCGNVELMESISLIFFYKK